MIGKLKGVVDAYGEDHVILDVNGVGYIVYCSTRTLGQLPRPGEAASLAIETVVREDQIRLYGFATPAEREWFRMLTTVQGVGNKVALGLLSAMRPNELAGAIALQDKGMLARAPGVGPKLAQRIVSELKDKAPVTMEADPVLVRLQSDMTERRAPQPVSDAVSALINLGYGQIQASAAVSAALKQAGDAAAAETLIRLGLRELAK